MTSETCSSNKGLPCLSLKALHPAICRLLYRWLLKPLLFFRAALQLYSGGQKCRHLQVDSIHALQTDCVDEKVACQMARQVKTFFISDFDLAVTGSSVKMPERKINDLYTFFAIARESKIMVSKKTAT